MSRFLPARRRSERGGIILRIIAFVIVAVLLFTIYLLRRPILRAVGELWVVDESLQPSDVIVLLGSDNFHADRATRAAELYKDRWAPRILASGGWVRPYANVSDLERRDLAERGVPAEAIVAFPNYAGNTREEAYAVRQLLREKKWTRIIVVTSNYHTRRARYIWTRAVDSNMQVRVVAARDADFDPRSWWESRVGLKRLFTEWAALNVTIFEMMGDEPPPGKLVTAPAR